MNRRSARQTVTASSRKYSIDECNADNIVLSVRGISEVDSQVVLKEVKSDTPVPTKPDVAAPAPPTKVLFLDGVRGLATTLVVTQHSHEYLQGFKLGAVAVDSFFVLSSFLLTWFFMKKSIKLLAQGASLRTWGFVLADYFSKRFFRVYPLFALTAIIVALLPFEEQQRYFLVDKPGDYKLFKVLTFEFHHRFFVLWTLPLEISYYFIIPVFVVVVLKLRRFWWIVVAGLSAWILYEGWNKYRTSHSPLLPHIPTFLSGSLAAVVFVKLDTLIKKTGFKFRKWHTVPLRAVEGLIMALLLSVCFRGLFFDWVHSNPASDTPGFPFVSAYLTVLFVIEMLHPSCVSTMFEWSVIRYWGKISFSVYLLHSFVVWNPTISVQSKYFNRLFSRFFLLCC